MSDDKMQGEGNYAADRRYRKGVRKTLSETTENDRARRARSMTEQEKTEAQEAEAEGKRHSRAKKQDQ
jgi:hypothetical protein